MRDKFENTITCSITKGPKMPTIFILYHQLLVEELKLLEQGIIVSGSLGEELKVRAVVDKFIFDRPGGCKSCYRVGVGGIYPCVYCITRVQHSTYSKTTLYLENRQFLDVDDSMRKENSFPVKTTEERPPPEMKPPVRLQATAMKEVKEDLERAKACNDKKNLRVFKQNLQVLKTKYGKTGREIWCDLQHYSTDCQMVDSMHTSANLIKTFMKAIRGLYQAKSVKDVIESGGKHLEKRTKSASKRKRHGEAESGGDTNRGESQPSKRKKTASREASSENGSENRTQDNVGSTEAVVLREKKSHQSKQDQANKIRKENEAVLRSCSKTRGFVSRVTLNTSTLEQLDQLMKKIKLPSYFGPVPLQAFINGTFQNTDQCIKFATEGLLQFALKDYLGEEGRKTITDLCFVIAMINLPVVNTESCDQLERQIADVLARKEKLFPEFANTLMCHLLIHMPNLMKNYGPTCHYCMFSGERLMSSLMQRMKLQRRYPGRVALDSSKTHFLCSVLEKAGLSPAVTTKKAESHSTILEKRKSISNILARHVKYHYINRHGQNPEEICHVPFSCRELQHPLFGRYYTYKGDLTDNNNNSVVVCTKKDSLEHFVGTIQSIIESTPKSAEHNDSEVFLDIKWLGKCHYEKDSRLWWVEECDVGPLPPIIPYTCTSSEWYVSRPLVHINDDSVSSKFWILNFHEHYIFHPEAI